MFIYIALEKPNTLFFLHLMNRERFCNLYMRRGCRQVSHRSAEEVVGRYVSHQKAWDGAGNCTIMLV